MKTLQPTRKEIEEYLKQAKMCLSCNAPECHEFTPEGVDVCAALPFWNGKPITREMLLAWQGQMHESRGN